MASILKTDKIEGVTASGTVQMPAGHVIQLVTNTYSTETVISSSTYTDTGLTCQITPKFSSSKIFILVSQHMMLAHPTADTGAGWKIFRDSTEVKASAVNYAVYAYTSHASEINIRGWQNWNYLDSPSSTSQLTYKTQISKYGGGNLEIQDSNNPSTLTLMEIAQ